MAKNVVTTSDGTHFTVVTPWGSLPFYINTPGIYNVYNALAAISACLIENIPLDQIKNSLEAFQGIRGRFQNIRAGQKFRTIVDYAHNPNGLSAVLKTAREITSGRLICVMGSRGNRDRLKRPIMASIAATYSDLVIFTSDNSYAENSEQILSDMIKGLETNLNRPYEIVMNRKQAIRQALETAKDDDCIIITGRGHETKQVIGDCIELFSDEDVVKGFLLSLR
jgi:UDP-N-acetylmuramoyl-L-alanyl-D-glutamate--2,6-diaminopimelate ligase